jgi:hypothetical protein
MSAITRLNCLLAPPFLPVFVRFPWFAGCVIAWILPGLCWHGLGFIVDFSDLNRSCTARRAFRRPFLGVLSLGLYLVVVVNLDSHMDTVEILGSVVCLRSCCDCVPCSPLLLCDECICPFGGLLARKKFFFVFGSFTTKSHLVGFFYISPFDWCPYSRNLWSQILLFSQVFGCFLVGFRVWMASILLTNRNLTQSSWFLSPLKILSDN